jgi:flagellar hook-associated protein 1 FlgK
VASFLNIGLSALNAFQRELNTTAHNVANVDTPGYSRQVVQLSTLPPSYSGNGWAGSGVTVATVRRQYDAFLADQVRGSLSASGEANAMQTFATQLDDLYADPSLSLDSALQQYFSALNDVANDPTSVAARQSLLAEAETLVERFHFLAGRTDEIARSVNQQLQGAVDDVNGISKAIADLNDAIVKTQGTNDQRPPNDLLDQRDELVNRLSSLVQVSYYEQDDGALNVFIGNGQTLVLGNRATPLSVAAGDTDTSQLRIMYGTGSAARDISTQLRGGEIGGLLRVRSELIEPSQSRLGLVAAGLADAINQQHQLGIDLTGTLGGDFFSAATGEVLDSRLNSGTGSVAITLADVSALQPSDYRLSYDGTDYTLTRLSDGKTWTNPVTVDGFTLGITAGAAAGDSFLIRPVRSAASDIAVALSDVNRVAAAAPLRAGAAVDANGAPVNAGSARIGAPTVGSATGLPLASPVTLTFSADADGLGHPGFVVGGVASAPLLYDPTTESAGKTFTIAAAGDVSFTISGVPVSGDGFVVGNNGSRSSDNRNALALAAVQRARPLLGGSATVQDGFAQVVSDVGTRTRQAQQSAEAQAGLLSRAQEAQSAVSGVNLDEEAANLIHFQQLYQAAAQVITVAQTLFDTLLAAVRR